MQVKKEKFIYDFVAGFMSTYAVTKYIDGPDRSDECVVGPSEDAFYIAQIVWEDEIFRDECKKSGIHLEG